MLKQMIVAVNAVLPSFLIIALGALTRRRGRVDEKSLGRFNAIAFRIFLPCQIFKNVFEASAAQPLDGRLALFTALGLIAAGGLALLTAALVEPRRDRRGVVAQGMFRGNYVLLAMPMLDALFGAESAGISALMIAIIIPVYNVLSVIFLELYAGGRVDPRRILRSIVKNPLIGATLAALLAKAVRFPFEEITPLRSTVTSLGAAATPLCLFILGGSFTLSGVRGYARSLWLTVVFKLVIFPGLAILGAALLGIRGVALGVVLMAFGAPTAVNSYTMARELGGDTELAAGIVVVDTALSCVTLFLWIVLLGSLGLF